MARLGDVCNIQSGGTPSRGVKDYWDNGTIPWVKISDLSGKYLSHTSEKITQAGLDNSSAKIFHKGTILYTIFATLGEVCILDIDATTNQAIAGLKLNDTSVSTDYLYYYLLSRKEYVNEIGRGVAQNNINIKILREMEISIPSTEEQKRVAETLNKVYELIALRKEQLAKLDELVKARFVELFGDPITNSNNLPTERMEQRFSLKAGITTAADDIHDFVEGAYEIPCYGGNGIRGYVKEKSYTGDYPIIGRQGALCGNVQYATGDFHATEHAVLVSLLKNDNSVWVYHLLKLMDLYRYHTGAAQPGLAVKTLNTVEVMVADKSKQDQFAAFVEQTDKSKLTIQQSLDKLETLKKSLMQEYFG